MAKKKKEITPEEIGELLKAYAAQEQEAQEGEGVIRALFQNGEAV